MIKVVVILFILIGMAYAASQMFEIIETEDGQFQFAIDSAMKQAIEKGEFQFPDNVGFAIEGTLLLFNPLCTFTIF